MAKVNKTKKTISSFHEKASYLKSLNVLTFFYSEILCDYRTAKKISGART